MHVSKKHYTVCVENNAVVFYRENKKFFTVPASARVNEVYSDLSLHEITAERILFFSSHERMIFSLFPDCIVVEYRKCFDEETPIFKSHIFASPEMGMMVENFDRAFCPQPRQNGGANMDYYHHLPDISANAYNSPSILEFSLGNTDGWVSVGLLDLPDTKICKMCDDFSFLVESCGGNKVVSEYTMPRILITFPTDEMDAVSLFRSKLIELGAHKPSTKCFSELPAWWRNPLVCTYGDQLVEHRVGTGIDEAWIEEFVDVTEREWGLDAFNLVIDDSWQYTHSFLPVADTSRFPNLRSLIDRLHERGHHVLLWVTPMFDKLTNGFKTRSEELEILSDTKLEPPLWGNYFEDKPGCVAIDYTADNARQFLREVCEQLLGSGEGQYNADGVKMDFMGLLRDPEEAHYAHPERGMGHRELLLFYQMMHEEAKCVKPDAVIDCTVGDPRFEDVIDFNRLHDTHCGTREKEIRAELVVRACPALPIDSDGALMFNSWLATHYISAAVYGIPSNYYAKAYQDVRFNKYRFPNEQRAESRLTITPDEKRRLGELFKMSRYKPDGIPHFESFGNWVLRDGDQINAISQRGETVVYYPTDKDETGYIFTFQDEVIFIPLYGRKIAQITPAPKQLLVDYARDRAIMRLIPGVIHTFQNRDAGDGIEQIFQPEAARAEVDGMVDYVNG